MPRNRKPKDATLFDVILVGNYSIDVNTCLGEQISNSLGGAPVYSGSIFTLFGNRTALFSQIGFDYYEEAVQFCRIRGIDFRGLRRLPQRTLAFENTYDDEGNRRQKCFNTTPKLLFKELPREYFDSKAFYIAPIMGEVDLELLKELRRKEITLMLDPQGLMRNIGEEGRIELTFNQGELEPVFELVDIVKIGNDEFQASNMEVKDVMEWLKDIGVSVGIVTRGKEKVTIASKNTIIEVPTINVAVEDPTGAGDVFGAAFLSEYLRGYDAAEAAKIANIAAGLKIRYKGPNGFPTRREVLRHKALQEDLL
ncbi:MAG: PfkB family carbohydrate kinase [Nitrososphaeria archaeon]